MISRHQFHVSAAALAVAIALPAALQAQTTYPYSDIDADGNLELSDTEFQQYSTGLFDRYDADADGFLSEDEYGLFGSEMGMAGDMTAWDAEADGLLSADEFDAGLYGAYDADGSLGIDEAEYANYGMGETVGGMDNTVQAEVVNLNDWGYDELYADGISVEALLDADVIGAEGEDIGEVENVLFGPQGELVSVIVEVGGFLDIGDTHLNIPWDMVETAEWSEEGIAIPFTEEQLSDGSYGLFNEEYGYGYDEGYGETEIGLGEEGLGEEGLGEEGLGEETEIGLGEEGLGEEGLGGVTNETIVASEEVGEVGGDGVGQVETGPRVWRAADLIGDYARVREGEGYLNYGYVEDIVVRDGQIAAVLVSGDRGFGLGGTRAFPYTGAGYNNWNPGLGYYDLPYDRTEVETVEAFDDDQLLDY